jgi:hypothetical protein
MWRLAAIAGAAQFKTPEGGSLGASRRCRCNSSRPALSQIRRFPDAGDKKLYETIQTPCSVSHSTTPAVGLGAIKGLGKCIACN